jgi:hypothetical protein
VCLIDHQQLEQICRQLLQSPGEGLDAGHLHRRGQVHRTAGGDDAVPHAHRREGAAGLTQQLRPMHQHRDAAAAGSGLLGDVTEDQRSCRRRWAGRTARRDARP